MIFTTEQWLERFWQNTKRKYRMDIGELLLVVENTQKGSSEKEGDTQDNFMWDIGPEEVHQRTRAQNRIKLDKLPVKHLIRLRNKHLLPKRINIKIRQNIFWTKQTKTERPQDFWRKLIGIDNRNHRQKASRKQL